MADMQECFLSLDAVAKVQKNKNGFHLTDAVLGMDSLGLAVTIQPHYKLERTE